MDFIKQLFCFSEVLKTILNIIWMSSSDVGVFLHFNSNQIMFKTFYLKHTQIIVHMHKKII